MQDNKTIKIQRLIIAIIGLVGLGVGVVSFIWRLNSSLPIYSFGVAAAYYACIFYYGIYGYKKPHGNMVRYLLLILAIYMAYSITIMVERWNVTGIVFTASNVAAVLIGYMAGRLNKYKKNVLLIILISLLLLIKCFWPLDTSLNMYSLFILDRTMPLFMWLTVLFSYFLRYNEHKLAGISADSKNAEEDE